MGRRYIALPNARARPDCGRGHRSTGRRDPNQRVVALASCKSGETPAPNIAQGSDAGPGEEIARFLTVGIGSGRVDGEYRDRLLFTPLQRDYASILFQVSSYKSPK